MKKLFLFNPENDLALANGNANFTPSLAVRRFKESLAELPKWYANDGDEILTPDNPRASSPNLIAAPWGWSANTVAQFRKAGLQGPFPDTETIRQLSHRRTSVHLHRLLSQANLPYPLPPAPREITESESITAGNLILKSPWSCSGRGVTDCSAMSESSIRRIAAGIIGRQGSVMVEEKLPKTRDFALLFESSANKVTFKGISLFFNSSTATAYGGNLCASQDELIQILAAPYLDETISAVNKALEEIFIGKYVGPIGVDMLLYGNENLICPTVEINVRMTMGFVALSLYNRLGRGEFRVAPGQAPEGIQLIPSNPYFSATFTPKP